MENYESYYKAGEYICEWLKKEFVGPVDEEEVLELLPLQTYAVGILWPKTKEVGKEQENEDLLWQANQYRPSTMALSVVLPEEADKLTVSFQYAVYNQISETITIESNEDEKMIVKYKRKPVSRLYVEYDLRKKEWIGKGYQSEKVEIQVHKRNTQHGIEMYTISITNKQVSEKNMSELSTKSLFQCALKVECDQGFLPIEEELSENAEEEDKILHLLYRAIHNYAIGHGCSVNWEEAEGTVHCVYSESMPVVDNGAQIAPRVEENLECFLCITGRTVIKMKQ